MVETLEDHRGEGSTGRAESSEGEGQRETDRKKMEDPPLVGKKSPAAPSPVKEAPPRLHSRELSGSQYSEQFSEHNPLTGKDLTTLCAMEEEPKKPQAVALHGWQRTVGVDDDFDATIPVCLGAPGTGLSTAQVPHGGGTLVPGLGRGKTPRQQADSAAPGQSVPALGAVVDLGNVKVTREDKKEAKSLRVQPAAPGAAPLPYPRVADVSETEDSTDDDKDDDDKQQSERHHPFDTQSSSASSDMSFLVNTAAGAFFGTRQTFGRAVEPRIPATVGEERLHNSLAQYFGKSRKTLLASGEEGGETRSMSLFASGSATPAASTGGDAGGRFLMRQRSAGAAPTDAAAANGIRIAALSANCGSGSGSTMNTSNSLSSSYVGKAAAREISGGRGAESKRGETSANGGGAAAVPPGAKPRLAEERELVKQASFASGGEVPVEPGTRAPTCNCLRRWPWKILSGAATFVGVVAVVVLVVIATSGDSSGNSRRLLFAPQLLSQSGGSRRPTAAAAAAAVGGTPHGGGGRTYSRNPPGGYPGFSLSRRRLLAGEGGGGDATSIASGGAGAGVGGRPWGDGESLGRGGEEEERARGPAEGRIVEGGDTPKRKGRLRGGSPQAAAERHQGTGDDATGDRGVSGGNVLR